MRVWLKRIGIVCLVPVIFVLLVSVLLYVPPVQHFAVRKAMAYVAESTGIEVGFERLRLSFPLNLSVRNALVTGVERDTLAYLNKMTVEVALRPLLNGNIQVKGVRLELLELNTSDLLDGMVVEGVVGHLYLHADSLNLAEERALLNHMVLSEADVHLFMCDTTVADTAKSDVKWCIELNKVELKNVAFVCRMPCDSLFLDMRVDEAVLVNGLIDLGAGTYRASGFRAEVEELFYGTDLKEPASGLDFSHLRFTELALSLDSLYYGGGMNINGVLKEGSAKERSGLVVTSLAGRVEADGNQLKVPSFRLKTNSSAIEMNALVPWSSIDNQKPEGQLSLVAKGTIGKEDALLMIGGDSEAFRLYYPDTAFMLDVSAGGNLGDVTLHKFHAELPGAFQLALTGSVHSVADERLRTGRIDCSLEMQEVDFVAGLFPSMLQPRFRIPDSMRLNGYLTMDKGLYAADFLLRESVGKVRLLGQYDVFKKSYEANLDIDSLEPVHFMPDDSIMWLSASVRAKGQGTDVYRASTWAEVEGGIHDIYYGNTSVSDITLSASLKDNQLRAKLLSAYPLLRGQVVVDGEVKKEKIKGLFIVDVDSLDCYGLRLTDSPLATSFQVFSEVETDMAKTHSLDVTLGNIELIFEKQKVQPKMLTLSFRSEVDTVRASFHAGDMDVMLTGNADLNTLTDKLTHLSEEVLTQVKRDSVVNFQELRPFFPDISLRINAERDNPLYNFLQEYNSFFETFHLDATISPEEGLNVNGALVALVKDTLKIDTIRLHVWQDTVGLSYQAGVVKKRFRNQEAFVADVSGYLQKGEADVFVTYYNSKGENGFHFGVNAEKVSGEGFDFHLYPENPVIAFLPFTVNKDNYFRFKDLKQMDADLRLTGASNSSLWIHSEKDDDAMKEIMVELNQINLADISKGFADLPSLKGILNTTFRYEPMENSFMVVADGYIDDFYYENGRIGELLLNATYMPMEKGAHQIDMHALHNMSEIASLSLLYKQGRYENTINGVVAIGQLPMDIANAMIPGQMARLNGTLSGHFDVTGTDKKPILSGALNIENGSVFVVPSSTTLYFDDRQIKMDKNRVKLDKFKIYAQKENPFVIDGLIDATRMNRPTVDLKMTATNLQLIDAKKTPESLAYGRLFVNLNSTLTGPLQSLRMRGNLRVLGNTNMTYVMLDSPLEVQDRFSDLVTFTYFADTLPRRTRRPFDFVGRPRGTATMNSGADVLMTISIDPVVRVRVDLNEEQSNFVELRGGGDLSFQYNTQGDMSLSGRYTLSDGTIRYSIPVIPLTDFTVKNGSYVDWSGDLMNPYLNISAYTRVRSSVNFDGQSRMVDFNAGIELRDHLNDVSAQFQLESPTDAVVQQQLTSMGAEERGKQAVSLLVTGVYLASSGTGSDNMDVGAALNSLLQREMKNMLGSLLGDVPFSFDVNTYDGTQGKGRRIDYIGRFYKGFFDERLNTALGLRYSTKDRLSGDKFYLDDISLEYVLDTDGSRAIKVFRSKEYENMFEGEIAKIGASFSLRRKVKRFPDLFVFGKQKAAAVVRNEEENKLIEEPERSEVEDDELMPEEVGDAGKEKKEEEVENEE